MPADYKLVFFLAPGEHCELASLRNWIRRSLTDPGPSLLACLLAMLTIHAFAALVHPWLWPSPESCLSGSTRPHQVVQSRGAQTEIFKVEPDICRLKEFPFEK